MQVSPAEDSLGLGLVGLVVSLQVLVVAVQTLAAELVLRFDSDLVDLAVGVEVETPLADVQVAADVAAALGPVGATEGLWAEPLVPAGLADLCVVSYDGLVMVGLSAT